MTRRHWAGALLSLAGIYLLVGRGVTLSQSTMYGDALCLAAVACWSIYTVASRPLLERHAPMTVTGFSMAIGTALYVPFGMADLRALDWGAVSLSSWLSLAFSGVFALFLALPQCFDHLVKGVYQLAQLVHAVAQPSARAQITICETTGHSR